MSAESSKFRQWADARKHLNPETDNKVLFHSLPLKEQARIYKQWSQTKAKQEEGGGGGGKVKPRKYPATQQGFRVSPKEKNRASKDGVTIIVRPQENGSHGVFAVDMTGRHVGINWYEVESKHEISNAVRLLNRDLDKFHGRGDQMSERSRHRTQASGYPSEFQQSVGTPDPVSKKKATWNRLSVQQKSVVRESICRWLREFG